MWTGPCVFFFADWPVYVAGPESRRARTGTGTGAGTDAGTGSVFLPLPIRLRRLFELLLQGQFGVPIHPRADHRVGPSPGSERCVPIVEPPGGVARAHLRRNDTPRGADGHQRSRDVPRQFAHRSQISQHPQCTDRTPRLIQHKQKNLQWTILVIVEHGLGKNRKDFKEE